MATVARSESENPFVFQILCELIDNDYSENILKQVSESRDNELEDILAVVGSITSSEREQLSRTPEYYESVVPR